MFLNELPDEVKSYCKLFADDAKINKDLQNLEDFETIQNDINKLCDWTIQWLMLFNVENLRNAKSCILVKTILDLNMK